MRRFLSVITLLVVVPGCSMPSEPELAESSHAATSSVAVKEAVRLFSDQPFEVGLNSTTVQFTAYADSGDPYPYSVKIDKRLIGEEIYVRYTAAEKITRINGELLRFTSILLVKPELFPGDTRPFEEAYNIFPNVKFIRIFPSDIMEMGELRTGLRGLDTYSFGMEHSLAELVTSPYQWKIFTERYLTSRLIVEPDEVAMLEPTTLESFERFEGYLRDIDPFSNDRGPDGKLIDVTSGLYRKVFNRFYSVKRAIYDPLPLEAKRQLDLLAAPAASRVAVRLLPAEYLNRHLLNLNWAQILEGAAVIQQEEYWYRRDKGVGNYSPDEAQSIMFWYRHGEEVFVNAKSEIAASLRNAS